MKSKHLKVGMHVLVTKGSEGSSFDVKGVNKPFTIIALDLPYAVVEYMEHPTIFPLMPMSTPEPKISRTIANLRGCRFKEVTEEFVNKSFVPKPTSWIEEPEGT